MILIHAGVLEGLFSRIQRFALLLAVVPLLAENLQAQQHVSAMILPFGAPGKLRVLYDARQRPPSVYLNGRLFIVFNGHAIPNTSGKVAARPLLITYAPENRTFSHPEKRGPRDADHHFSPIIWADADDDLRTLYGSHNTSGSHLISDRPAKREVIKTAWNKTPPNADRLSYTTVFRIGNDWELP